MPEEYISGNSDYDIWRKILMNQGGPQTYVSGESLNSILRKILTNQVAGFPI